jgi:hypothetical protein
LNFWQPIGIDRIQKRVTDKRIRAGKQSWKCFKPECKGSREKNTEKTHVMTATE